MASHLRKHQELIGHGGVQECWVEEQTIGEEFHFASGPKISKEEALMGLVTIGLLAMMISNLIMIRIDELIGVFGTNEGLENDPDGIFLPPPKPRLHELFIKRAAEQAQVRVIPFTTFYSY